MQISAQIWQLIFTNQQSLSRNSFRLTKRGFKETCHWCLVQELITSIGRRSLVFLLGFMDLWTKEKETKKSRPKLTLKTRKSTTEKNPTSRHFSQSRRGSTSSWKSGSIKAKYFWRPDSKWVVCWSKKLQIKTNVFIVSSSGGWDVSVLRALMNLWRNFCCFGKSKGSRWVFPLELAT